MKKFGYRLATILDKTGDDIQYTETGTLEYFSDLVDLAKYYDIKRNDGRKAYKEHYNSWAEACKGVKQLEVGDSFSYKLEI